MAEGWVQPTHYYLCPRGVIDAKAPFLCRGTNRCERQMGGFSAVLPAAGTQTNKCKCDCGPYCSIQKITSHSSQLGTQPSSHQWNKHLWAPSRALLPATAPAAEGTAKLAPAVETAPIGSYSCSASAHPLLLFYPKSLHSRCVSSHQAFLPCSPIHDAHSSTHPCFQAQGLPFWETYAKCFRKYKLKVLQSFVCCHTFCSRY